MIVACAGSQDQTDASHTPRSVGVGAMSSRKRSGVTPILPACCPPAPFFFSGLRFLGLRLLAPLVMSALPLGGVGSKALFLLPRTRGVPLPAAFRKGSKRKGRINEEEAVAFCSVFQGGKGARVVWSLHNVGRFPQTNQVCKAHLRKATYNVATPMPLRHPLRHALRAMILQDKTSRKKLSGIRFLRAIFPTLSPPAPLPNIFTRQSGKGRVRGSDWGS